MERDLDLERLGDREPSKRKLRQGPSPLERDLHLEPGIEVEHHQLKDMNLGYTFRHHIANPLSLSSD